MIGRRDGLASVTLDELIKLYPEPERAQMRSGVQPDGRWNFIHQHVGNRKTRRAAKAKQRRETWKAWREANR
jgi:hypothetical protein